MTGVGDGDGVGVAIGVTMTRLGVGVGVGFGVTRVRFVSCARIPKADSEISKTRMYNERVWGLIFIFFYRAKFLKKARLSNKLLYQNWFFFAASRLCGR
jgi:hypothetical protein